MLKVNFGWLFMDVVRASQVNAEWMRSGGTLQDCEWRCYAFCMFVGFCAVFTNMHGVIFINV